MLDGLLGRSFASKCKSLIKLIKHRIDVIRRKRNATQKFLKKDIADLLANGLDINAYGRAEGLLAELNVSYCYDFVEHCCDFVSKSLTVMQKVCTGCPGDCREAVSSLMFAAARFSDLPELRDLRNIFQERYGNSVEHFVNKEFSEKLSSTPPTMNSKIQLMQTIATEFSIKWDSHAFQERACKPAAREHVFQPRQVPSTDGLKPLYGREDSTLKVGDLGISLQGKQEAWNEKEETLLKTVRGGSSTNGKRMEHTDGTVKPHGGRENAVPKRESKDSSPYGKPFIAPSYATQHAQNDGKDLVDSETCRGQHNANLRRAQEEEMTKWKAYYNNALPPPYVKSKDSTVISKDSKHGANLGSSHLGFDHNGVHKDPSEHIKAKSSDISEKVQLGSDHHRHEREAGGAPRVSSHDDEKNLNCKDDVAVNSIPKPRSARRRHHKAASGHDDAGNGEIVKRKSRSRRRDDSSRGLQILFDDEQHRSDEEERKMDKLLMYYSKKPSTYEPGLVTRKPRSHQAHHVVSNAGEAPQTLNRDMCDKKSELVLPPVRSRSLPHEQPTPLEARKVFARAASFQPERSSEARHVHPKLPDYDDLAARFAALKGR